MSELKATRIKMVYNGEVYDDFGTAPCSQLYFRKEEAVNMIAHHKYKRCLAMAKWCHNQREIYERDSYNWELNNEAVASLRNKANIMRKWHRRWLELAEKFKEAK